MTRTERRLKERVKELEAELDEIRRDRQKFRDHFVSRFRWWIELLGKDTSPKVSWLVEDDAKWLRNLKWWSW